MRAAAPVSLLLLLLATDAARACPGCYQTLSDDVLGAYFATAIGLSVLPFGIVGAITATVWWYGRSSGPAAARRRMRRRLRLVRGGVAG
jgi:hypothetical protein